MRAKLINEYYKFKRNLAAKDSLDLGIRRGFHKELYLHALDQGFKPIQEEQWEDELMPGYSIDDVIDIYKDPSGRKVILNFYPDHTSMFPGPDPQYAATFHEFKNKESIVSGEFGTGMFGPDSNREVYFMDWNNLY